MSDVQSRIWEVFIVSEKILYLDAFAGISGDMFLGALTDILRKLDSSFDLAAALSGIGVDGWHISVAEGKRGGIAGAKIDVHAHEHHPHRHLSDVKKILTESDFSSKVREMAERAFSLLAEAEAKVHGTTPEEIHFHEVGAIDAIVDIAGAMLLMERLGWPQILSSPVNVGSGTVACAHGILPVPAPATAELLAGLATYAQGEPVERTTPTGAALLRTLVGEKGFVSLPAGRIACTGIGLGGRDTPGLPNVLRVLYVEVSDAAVARFDADVPRLIETNIDDMNPQDFAVVMEKLLASGALDAWCENILMKKGRPAVKLSCLAAEGDVEALAELILRETTTLGVRISQVRRLMLHREIARVVTPYGDVRVKRAELDGKTLRRVPEFDDLAAVAREKKVPMQEIRASVARETEEGAG